MVDGDARSAAIAAASVIAKVTRDRYMHRIAADYPDFEFDGNVGYSTPEHRAAIIEHGPSPLHRRSFASIAYSQLPLSGRQTGSGRVASESLQGHGGPALGRAWRRGAILAADRCSLARHRAGLRRALHRGAPRIVGGVRGRHLRSTRGQVALEFNDAY